MFMRTTTREANERRQHLLVVADELRGLLDESSTLSLQPGTALVEDNFKDWSEDNLLPRCLEVEVAGVRLLVQEYSDVRHLSFRHVTA